MCELNLKCYSILGEIDDSSSDENTTPTVDLTLPYCSNYTALGYKCVKVRTFFISCILHYTFF